MIIIVLKVLHFNPYTMQIKYFLINCYTKIIFKNKKNIYIYIIMIILKTGGF